jgi:phage-related protein
MSTFTWSPSYGANLSIRPRVTRVAFGDGYEQRIASGLNNVAEVWSLAFQGRSKVDALAIDAFLREAAALTSFDWTSPSDTEGKFVCDEWSVSVDDIDVYTVRATFRQVFDLR